LQFFITNLSKNTHVRIKQYTLIIRVFNLDSCRSKGLATNNSAISTGITLEIIALWICLNKLKLIRLNYLVKMMLQHEEIIANADRKIRSALEKNNNNDQYLLGIMLDDMQQIKKVMDTLSTEQMDKFCDKYENFRHYMRLLNKLAEFVATERY
jgi:hypothetical protein